MNNIKSEKNTSNNPQGYCENQQSEPCLAVPHVPWKRANLGDEVRALHIMHDAAVIPPSTTGYMNKGLICKLIDDLLEVQKPTQKPADRVKRKLFIKLRETPRKSIPKKRAYTFSFTFKFKNIRPKFIDGKIKKNYLDEAREIVLQQKFQKCRLPSTSSASDSPTSPEPNKPRHNPLMLPTEPLNIDTSQGVLSISSKTLSEICKFHEKMVRSQPAKERSQREHKKRMLNTVACRLSRRLSKLTAFLSQKQYSDFSNVQRYIIEETLRSSHVLGLYMNLIAQHN